MKSEEFEREYTKVKDKLFSFLMRLTANRDEAEEILQEAVYRAYRKRAGFRGQSAFSTWLYRIAVNHWKNERKKNARSLPLEAAGNPEPAGQDADPEEMTAFRQESRKLRAGLERLSEDYRVPLMLKHMEGFSYREISHLLDIGEEAARVRVYRARHTLAAILKEETI
jgi:RNA polymerase sigma-70 factor (ECF subfamily)